MVAERCQVVEYTTKINLNAGRHTRYPKPLLPAARSSPSLPLLTQPPNVLLPEWVRSLGSVILIRLIQISTKNLAPMFWVR